MNPDAVAGGQPDGAGKKGGVTIFGKKVSNDALLIAAAGVVTAIFLYKKSKPSTTDAYTPGPAGSAGDSSYGPLAAQNPALGGGCPPGYVNSSAYAGGTTCIQQSLGTVTTGSAGPAGSGPALNPPPRPMAGPGGCPGGRLGIPCFEDESLLGVIGPHTYPTGPVIRPPVLPPFQPRPPRGPGPAPIEGLPPRPPGPRPYAGGHPTSFARTQLVGSPVRI